MKKIIAGIFAVTIASSAFAAPAAPQGVTREVHFGGIDLASAEGEAMLNERITRAVRQICGQRVLAPLQAAMAQRDCTLKAFASAKPQVELAIAKARGGNRYAGDPAVIAIAPTDPKGL